MPIARVELEQTDHGWIGAVEAGGPAGRRTIALPPPGQRIDNLEAAQREAARAYRAIVGIDDGLDGGALAAAGDGADNDAPRRKAR